MASKISYLITLQLSLTYMSAAPDTMVYPFVSCQKRKKREFPNRSPASLLPSVLIHPSVLLALYSFLADLIHKIFGISPTPMFFKCTHVLGISLQSSS